MDEIKQAKEEYLKKFLEDVEKLAEKEKKYNENEVNQKASKVEKNRGEFKKGRSKTGGRTKGTPNKKTAQFKEMLGNFDTVAELKFLYETCENNDLKFAICKEFLKYEYPQRKAIELAEAIELPPLEIKGL